ncbi:MAG: DUF3343 domain-containing protein [Thermodesulfobacteriota bacterium]
MEYLATFTSTYKVLKAEKVLKGNGIPFRLLPSPKVLLKPSQCGLVIAFNASDMAIVEDVLIKARVRPSAVYVKGEEGNYVKV